MFARWFRSLHRHLGQQNRAFRQQMKMSKRRSVALALESLEDRVVPSANPPLIALSYFENAVYSLDVNTGAVQQTLVPPGGLTVDNPAGMTNGPDGNLYFSSQGNDSIDEYNLSTGTLSTFIPSSVLTPIAVAANGPGSVFAPAGLAFGPDHDLYVSLNGGQSATGGGEVIRFNMTASGGSLVYGGTFTTVATGLVQPTEMTFGVGSDSASLYVSNSVADTVVKIANATGASPTSSVFITGNSTNNLNYPSGLTWGPDGNLYVVDLGATNGIGQVLQFSPTGAFNEVFAGGDGSLVDQFPSDAIFAPDGDLLTANLGATYPVGYPTPPGESYLAVGTSGSINEYNPDGSFNQVLTNSSFPPNFDNPLGVGVTNFSPSQIVLDGPQPLTLMPLGNAADTVFVPYNQTISTVGGSSLATLSVSHIHNAIPGLHISGNGTNTIHITGTPLSPGTETFTVSAVDSNGDTSQVTYSVTVNPALSLSPLFLPLGTTNSAYGPVTITASGGTGSNTLAVSILTSVPGLTISGSGTSSVQVSGTPTAAGIEIFSVTATDSVGATTTWWYAVAVLPAGNPTLSALILAELDSLDLN
jgi:hypothetical protein